MRWLSFLNVFLVIASVMTGVFLFFIPKDVEETSYLNHVEKKAELPKSPFFQPDEAYHSITEGPFSLRWIPLQLQLPDLRNELVFLGRNGRPDRVGARSFFHISLKGSEDVKSVASGEKTYLVYQKIHLKENLCREQTDRSAHSLREVEEGKKGFYSFSLNNQPTPLWFEVKEGVEEHKIDISIGMIDENGTFIRAPHEHQTFSLKLNDQRKQILGWELGPHRVDSTLLVRQKARWIGPDLFLERHGGEDFEELAGRERIDFLEGENAYFCFVKAGDYLIWKNNRWNQVFHGEQTEGFPLLVVKKIEEKIMALELWDMEGSGKIFLSLIRIKNPVDFPNLAQEFRFVGAKTWAQFIIETRNGRMILKPHDWLVLTNNEWIKLSTPKEIDDYVEQKLSGPLFILDKLTKKNGKQVLTGHIFNSSRTNVEEVELVADAPTPLVVGYEPKQAARSLNIQPFDLREK